MGCFGYICPVCNTSIRGDCFGGGELCVLIHKRHGKEVGRTVGHYDEYGRVVEDEAYRGYKKDFPDGDNPNTHEEICNSEMRFPDSNAFGDKYILPDGKIYDRAVYVDSISYFEGMNSRFPSFSDNFTVKMQKEVDEFKKAKKLWLTKYRPETPFTEEELELIETYNKFYMHMPEHFRAYYNKWVESLPQVIPLSGTVAAHKKCYDSLTEGQQAALPISKHDPNQSWGKVRKKYS